MHTLNTAWGPTRPCAPYRRQEERLGPVKEDPEALQLQRARQRVMLQSGTALSQEMEAVLKLRPDEIEALEKIAGTLDCGGGR